MEAGIELGEIACGAGDQRPVARRRVIHLDVRDTRPGERHHAAVRQRYQRRIPAGAQHVVHLGPRFGRRVEDVRRVERTGRSAAADEQASVAQECLAGAEQILAEQLRRHRAGDRIPHARLERIAHFRRSRPEKHSAGPHDCRMHDEDRRVGEPLPRAGAASARVEIDDRTLVGMIERQFEAVRARELLGHLHGLDAAHQRRHPVHHVHLDVAVDEEVAAQAHLLPGSTCGPWP